MPERSFRTETWTEDNWFQELSRDQRYLSIYLGTNNHCKQSGVYHVTLVTMAFETKFSDVELPELLKSLSPEVEWYPEDNTIWVKNFLRQQAKSPKFVTAAISSLLNGNFSEDLIAEFELYNQALLSPDIRPQLSLTKRECVIIRDNFRCLYCSKEITDPADYEMDHITPRLKGGKDHYQNLATSCFSCNHRKLDKTPDEAEMITPQPGTFHAAQAAYLLKNDEERKNKWLALFPQRVAVADSILGNIVQSSLISYQLKSTYSLTPDPKSITSSDKGVRVEGKGEAIPPGKSEIEENLSEGDRKVISIWCSVKGFSMPNEEAAKLVASLRTEFPDVDILAESKSWVARKLSEPLKPGSRPSSQIWNWMRKAREFETKGGERYGAHRPGDQESSAERLRQSLK
ncbi:hypothetical protein ES704_01633 [subsurface metagenome]|jgi:hypothetical protein